MSRKTFLMAAASVAGSSHSGAAAAMLAQSLMHDDTHKLDSLTLERLGTPGITAPRRSSRSKRIGRVLRVLVKAAA
jgi:hypothetical protein